MDIYNNELTEDTMEEELVISDLETEDILSTIKDELILENILEQIEHPIENIYGCTDYLDIFESRYTYLSTIYKDSPNFISALNAMSNEIYSSVYKTITSKYSLSSTDTGYDIKTRATDLYHFFVLDYKDNLIDYCLHTILKEKKSLSLALSDIQYSKSMSANGLKKLLKNRNDAILIANLPMVLELILTTSKDNLEVIKELCNLDIAEITNYRINNYFLIEYSMSPSNTFNTLYFEPITKKTTGYSSIVSTIRTKLLDLSPKK